MTKTITEETNSEDLVKILEEIADTAAGIAYDITKATIMATGIKDEDTINA